MWENIWTESIETISVVHEGKKPYQCSICNAKFSLKNDLNKHLVSTVHSRGKLNSCTICNAYKSRSCWTTLSKMSFWKINVVEYNVEISILADLFGISSHAVVVFCKDLS